MKTKPLLFLFAAFLSTGITSPAQGQSNAIHGVVSDPSGAAMPHVEVVLTDSVGMPLDRTLTGEDGRYSFTGLSQGNYQVQVNPPEPYLAQAQTVTLWTGLNDIGRADFSLRRTTSKPNEPPPAPVFTQKVPAEAEQAYQQALTHLQTGKRDDGVRELHRATEIFPDYYAALNQLGLEAMQQGNLEETQKWFTRALEVHRESPSAHFGLGWAHYQAERLEDAERELQQAAQLNPRIADTHYFLGLTLLEQKRLPEAEAAFLKCRRLIGEKDRPDIYLYLTSIYDGTQRYAEAVKALKAYLENSSPEKRTRKLQDLLKRLEEKKKQASK